MGQRQFHGHVDMRTRFEFDLDHVAMHVDKTSHQVQAVAGNAARDGALGNFGDLAIFNAERSTLDHAVGQDQGEVR